MRHPATGCTTSGCRARAGSAAGSSPCRRARAAWGHLPRRWTGPATASRDNSSPGSFPNGWGWTCSSLRPRPERARPGGGNAVTTQTAAPTAATTPADAESRDPWLPMIVIAMGQALMSFNVSAIPVSMGGMVKSFNAPPTTVGTAVVLYSLGVSGFILLGAKLGQRFGSKIFFQAAVVLLGVAMVLMVISPTAEVMLAAQALAGLGAAGLVPTLVVLIADHYRGRQQAEAVGWLGSARAIAGVLAFVIVGFVAMLNWRLAFALLILHSGAILVLSFRLKPAQ